MKNTNSTIDRKVVGRDYSSNTHVVTKTHVGKFGTKNTMSSTTTTLGKNGEVLSKGSTSSSSSSISITSGIIGGSFATIFGALVLINLFNLLMGNGDFRGFEWFLNVLSNAPSIPIDWLENFSKLSIDVSQWGILAPIGNFLNLQSNILSTLLFICTGALNIITFVIYLLTSFLFLGL